VALAQTRTEAELEIHEPGHRRRLSPVSAWSMVSAFVFAIVVYLSSGPLDDPDVWWHVRLGRLILDSGHIPSRETWSYASLGHSWTPTAWLSDVVYGGLVNEWGYRSLIALKLAVCAAAALLVLRLIRRTGASTPAVAIAFALTMLPLTFFLRERPQAFSLLFVAWLAGQCEQVRRGGSIRVVPFLAIDWLWANVHGMWFLGPAFLLVAAAGDLADSRRDAVGRFRRHALIALGAVALAAVTPVGPRLVTQPFRVQSAAHLISEWLPTVLWHRSLAPYLVTLALLTLSFVRRREATPWAEGLWFVTVVGFSLVASRDVAPAMILLAAPLARGLDELVTLPAAARIPLAVPALVGLAGVGFAVAGAVTEPAVATSQPTRLVRELGTLPGPRHVLNDYTVGGLITGLQPRASVSIDGRTDNYSPSYVGRYIDALRLRGDWQHVLASLRPDSALLPVDAAMTHVLVAEYHWTVVDVQGGYALLERGDNGLLTLPEPASPLQS
jgi:hypothetical protein